MTQQPATPHTDHACVVLGVGQRAPADAAALQTLWQQVRDQSSTSTSTSTSSPAHTSLQAGGLQPNFCAVALLDSKAAHPALARWLLDAAPHAAVIAVAPTDLPAQAVQTHSPRLQALYGTGSVAEAAALAAAGPHAQLVAPRVVAGDGSATLAVALRRSSPLNCCLAAAARTPGAAAPNEGPTA